MLVSLALVVFSTIWSAAASVPQPSRRMERLTLHYINETVKAEDGLPQNTVAAIAQTPDGYLWFATQEGLARFNGVQFKVFDPANYPVMASSFLTALAVARDGSLWVGTWRGGAYRLANCDMQPLKRNDAFSELTINTLLERSDGNLWIGTDRGLYIDNQGALQRIGRKEGLPDEDVRALVEDHAGVVWIGTAEGGLVKWDGGRFSIISQKDGLPGNRVWALACSADGSVWAGCSNEVCRFQNNRMTRIPLGIRTKENVVRTLAVDRQQALWVGTQNEGIFRLRGDVLSHYTSGDGLSNDLVISLLEDREGIIWAGTAGGGANRFRERKITTYTRAEGLSHNVLWTAYPGRDGSIWIGTNGGGLNRLKDGRFSTYGLKQGLASLITTAVCESRDGTLWIGTGGNGVDRLVKGRISHFPLGASLQEKTIWSIHESADSTVWVGTAQGLFRISGKQVKTYSTQDGLAGNSVRAFSETTDGSLWLATDGGVSCISQGRIRSWNTTQGLATNFLLSVYAENNGDVWLGTRNSGLVLFHDGHFTTIKSSDGLFNDYVYQIIEDSQGRLWMSCNRGIFYLPKSEALDFARKVVRRVHCQDFGIDDGMNNPECNGGRDPAGCKIESGLICFPTMEGLAVIDPANLVHNSQPPPLHLEQMKVDKHNVTLKDLSSLPPGKGELEFHYTAPSFVSPKKVQFQYRLEPFDSEWVQAGSRRVAFYTNIPPGHYTFRFKACNNDGVWNERPVSFSFYLGPHFYQTTLFFVLCGLAIMLLLAGGVGLRMHQLTIQRRKLETLITERTQQLKEALQKVEELANTDALTGVANRRCLESWLLREWRRSTRSLNDLSVIMVDVDHFKLFNDNHGHQEGDTCLKQVAEVIRSYGRRPSDLTGRYGGEEFILILPATTLEGARIVAEKIRQTVEDLHIPHGHSPISQYVTISLGVSSTIPIQGKDYQELIAAADNALYQAKVGGRNRVCITKIDITSTPTS